MMRRWATWQLGNCAGQHFSKDNGDLTVSKHVTTPRGKARILVTTVGFRDTPDGRLKVTLDRYLMDPPTVYGGKKP